MLDAGEILIWHRRFGAESFNAAWELIERTGRTPDDDLEMLLAAAASRWHKGRLGGPERRSMGDWQLAHVASLLGLGDLALAFARRNLATAESEGWTGWRIASAHEGVARACAVTGDADGRRRHLDAARAALAEEPDDEDRAVVASQIATVPEL